MSATYRFVGDAAELFPAWSGTIAVAGVVRDPDAEGYVAPWDPGYQQPGELRPGQTFTGPDDLVGEVGHSRIERLVDGEWAPTVQPEPPVDEPPVDEPPVDEPPPTPKPRARRAAAGTQES